MAKAQTKLPYIKWYPQDLEAEPTLKLCSWEAGFLWVKLLGLMHQSPERGFLLKANGQPFTEEELVAVIAGATIEKIRSCLFELESQGVYSRDRRKYIYSRKMVAGEKRIENTKAKDREKVRAQKTKSGDKSEINSRYFEDKSDLAPLATDGNIKEISGSGDRSVVIPESRLQSPLREDNKKNTKKSSIDRPEEIPDQLWRDFLQIRKAKNLPLTPTALAGIRREADKAGMDLTEALTQCCESGWAGFKAEWIKNLNSQKGKITHANPERKPTRGELADEAVDRAVREIEAQRVQSDQRDRQLAPPEL